MQSVRDLRWTAVAAVVAVILWHGAVEPPAAVARAAPPPLPTRLSDRAFWELSTALSEPDGIFRSENLVSNEHTFQYVIPRLIQQVRTGGIYLGVAPDQNFTYIVATRPRMAFILDVRRGNLLQHLLYKAIVELSADRAEFVSRLFSKPRPTGLSARSTATQLFTAFAAAPSQDALYKRHIIEVTDQLTRRHGFPLTPDDLEKIEAIYFNFYWEGPSLRYSTSPGLGGPGRSVGFPTYEELMLQTDWDGVSRGYLASEDHFFALKAMQEKNLIVPVVGNFAGPKALRAIGRYAREHDAVVSTFYVSNVEQYLYQDGRFAEFARNVATLPIDGRSTFVRSVWTRFGYTGHMLGPDARATALYPIRDFVRDFQDGLLPSYYDLNSRSK
jgi:hypothetical protein